MSIRDWVNNRSGAMAVLTIVAIALLLAVMVWQFRGPAAGPPGGGERYYLDLDTHLVFRDAVQSPPVTTPAGTLSGAIAHIFSCGECPAVDFDGMSIDEVDQAGAFVHHVETLPEEAIEVIARYQHLDELTAAQRDELFEAEHAERVVARVDRLDRWYSRESAAFYHDMGQSLEQQCPSGEELVQCEP